MFDYFNMADLGKGEELKYLGIIAHYSNICGFETLCTGHSQRLFRPEIQASRLDPSNPDRYFGYFRGVIRPNPFDRYGALPHKEANGRLAFSNEERVYIGVVRLRAAWTRLNISTKTIAATACAEALSQSITVIKRKPLSGQL